MRYFFPISRRAFRGRAGSKENPGRRGGVVSGVERSLGPQKRKSVRCWTLHHSALFPLRATLMIDDLEGRGQAMSFKFLADYVRGF